MITWAELFEIDGRPLQSGYAHLGSRLTTRLAGVLDRVRDEPWFYRDAPWETEIGSGLGQQLKRTPGCGPGGVAHLLAIRSGSDVSVEPEAQRRVVIAQLSELEFQDVESLRASEPRKLPRMEFLRSLIVLGLEARRRGMTTEPGQLSPLRAPKGHDARYRRRSPSKILI